MESAADTSTSKYNENHPPNPARIEQDTVTLLPSLSFAPLKDLAMDLGLKAELINTNGSATYNRDYRTTSTNLTPDGIIDEFINVDTANDRKSFSQKIGLKYSGAKNTVFYAESELEKELIKKHEIQDAFGPNPATGQDFERKTDSDSFNQSFTLGSKWYPAAKINVTAEYKYKDKLVDNKHKILLGDVVNGYKGYIDTMHFVS
jgi:hypothetical protein